jgi:hypothetical protein
MAYVLIKNGGHMKTGDQEPDLVLRLRKENHNPEDLTSINDVSVQIAETGIDELTVDDNTSGNVAVSEADFGEVTYSWDAGDTEKPGTYKGEVEVEFTSGETKTFPSSGTFKLYIEEALK